MADFSAYLDPSIVNYVQGLPVVQPLGLETTMGPRGTGMPGDPSVPAPPPPPPPPPPPQPTPLAGPGRKGGESAPPDRSQIGLFGAPGGDEVPNYGIPPEIVAHVQGQPIEQPSTVPSVTGGALPTDAGMIVPSAPVNAAPDLAPVAIPQMTPKQVAASNKQYDQRQAAQAAYEALPEGLAAKADDEQRGAIAKEQQANADALAAEQAQNTATANALAASQQRQAEQDKIDQAKAAEDQANVQKYTQQYAQQVKDAADYKVDTNRDVGVRGMIAIALSGIGDALDHRHGPNAAAQIISQQINDHIADQWAQKRALGDKAQGTNAVLDQFRRTADSDAQAQALHTAAETKRVADEIRQIGAQYANPAAKARAEEVAASLDTKSAAITMGQAQRKAQAIRDAQEERDRQANIGIAAGHLALAKKQFDASRTDADREFALQVAKLGGTAADARAAAAKDLATNGVFDASSGSAVLDADGQKMVDAADQLEVKARALPADQQAQAKQQAAQMRQDAELLHGFRIEDKDARREVVNSVGAGQKLIDTIGRIKATLAQDPSSIDRSTWAGLKTDFESAKADWIEAHKGKPSSREFEAISDMFGADPDSLTSRLAGRSKMESSLDQLKSMAISDTTTDLHKHGYKGTWRPRGLDRDVVPPLQGQTSVEAADDATPGPASVLNPFSGTASLAHQAYGAITGTPTTSPDLAAENSGDVTPTGLTKTDTQQVQGLIGRYKNATDAERGKILTSLTTYASSDRPALASGVLGLVKQDPELYKAVVSALPPQQQATLGVDAQSATRRLQTLPVSQLSILANTGDRGAQAEIAGRADKGDPEARQALLQLIGGR